MVDAPAGTVALLFTDVEGSTRLARELGPAWAGVLDDHRAIVGGAIEAHGGFVDGTEGDAFFATFADPAAAARAAVAALRGLRAHPWPDAVGGELGVRMGLHVGHVERRPNGYVGLEVHRAARVGAAAHGGQLLLTAAADALRGEELATEPLGGHRLKDFPAAEQLFCAVVDGRGAAAFPPPRTLDVRPTNLPAGGQALLGRDDDLARVRAALLDDGERLLTLTGRGGTGKTSLALAAGLDVLDEHPGGVWWVPLADLDEPSQVLPAVASALRADGRAGVPAADLVADRLRGRGATLLVLDNVEHVTAAAGDLARLLEALGDLRILTTSQVPLHLRIERIVALDTLDADAGLALMRRTAERAGARVDAPEPALREIVAMLDGLPLALELAAARLAVLTPEQLRDRLGASTQLLTDRSADRPERHRSLQATIEWTLGLLAAEPRALFERMGAFARPAELDDLEAVAGADGLAVLDALAVLLEVALVRRVEDGDGRVRFGLPEALRQVAGARLDATPDGAGWRRRHAEHQLEIAWPARLGGFSPIAVYDRAAGADAEARAALRWARTAGAPLATPLAVAVAGRLGDVGQTADALDALAPVLAAPTGDPALDALAVSLHGYIAGINGDGSRALELLSRAVDTTDASDVRCFALGLRAFMQTLVGEPRAGVQDAVRATALSRGLDPAAQAATLLMEAQARLYADEFDTARERFAEAERLDAIQPCKLLLSADTFRGDLAMRLGRPADALGPYARSLSIAQRTGNELQMLFDLLGIALALAELERDTEALEVTGIAEAQGTQVVTAGEFASAAFIHLLGDAPVAAATARLGEAAAAERRAAGRAVPAARRVAAACAIAHARAVAV